MDIYVGNLSREITEEELRQAFTAFGEVTSIRLMKDKYSGQPKGFAFVEMASKAAGEAAIAGLKGTMLKYRMLDLSEARPRSDNKGKGSYGSGRGGGYRGGNSRRY